ncbi:MAG: YicC family protein [Candidatus Tectomicrobia bacterium]|uniref:YicC family protein n=1 Tax=Tectimicrobiota bacterium TaxID=2528274 RepID=A0A932MNR8_UNCTE|nr:YicC family protein [Candidatus Tectomicrobia bacterium]
MATESMTGYGSGQRPLRGGTLTVEARSVNHRFLEASVRGPRWSLSLESEVREAIKARFARGRFDVYIRLDETADGAPAVDPAAARALVNSLRALAKDLKLPGDVDISLLAGFRDALRPQESSFAEEELRGPLLGALGEALDTLGGMRRREGAALDLDLMGLLAEVERICGEIRERVPEAREAIQSRLRERLVKLAEGLTLDPGRLEQELIYAAERGDISEELSRLESHIVQFREMLAAPGPAGRKLDFLVQEMNREANTIASKSSDLPLTQRAVDLKSAIERIREQVQNAE